MTKKPYTNAELIRIRSRRKYYKDRLRRLQKKIVRADRASQHVQSLIRTSDYVTEVYEGIALYEYHFLGRGWTRSDLYMSNKDERCGRYWDNAHNPGKGEWNIELVVKGWRGGPFRHEEQKFFEFSYGTEEDCILACKRWAAFGELPDEGRQT